MATHEFGGGWTEEKLQILDHYLTAYCKIFHTNPRAKHLNTIYVDAFAGTGLIQQRTKRDRAGELFAEFTEPETVEFLNGSAARALQHLFTQYIFIEKSASRVAELEKLRAASPHKTRIVIRKGDANTRLLSLVESTDWRKARAVVFLDPYGMQVDWKTIQQLGKTAAVDLWLLFPLGQAVMRLLRKEGEPPAEWQEALDRIFGTHEWYARFYITEREPGLFENEIVSTRRVADWQTVGAFMIERLQTAFHAVDTKPGILPNSQNVALYLFCFASANPKGAPTALKIARDLLKRIGSQYG
jgi:three-Cys-motif partner protein